MAPEQEVPTRALYDHENDEPRRRHTVADWGVGEDIFDRMPSRRFTRGERRADHHQERERMAAGESRTIVIERVDEALEALESPRAEPEAAPVMPPEGRRTVVIKGHPERLPAARPPRPRTAVERIGTSPDRIVAYAVALGFLLVLIAVLTTGQ